MSEANRDRGLSPDELMEHIRRGSAVKVSLSNTAEQPSTQNLMEWVEGYTTVTDKVFSETVSVFHRRNVDQSESLVQYFVDKGFRLMLMKQHYPLTGHLDGVHRHLEAYKVVASHEDRPYDLIFELEGQMISVHLSMGGTSLGRVDGLIGAELDEDSFTLRGRNNTMHGQIDSSLRIQNDGIISHNSQVSLLSSGKPRSSS